MAFSTDWDVEQYKSEYESEEQWELRKRFMETHKHKFPEDKLVCYARVFFNMEFLGCSYPEKTMKLVSKLADEVAHDYRNARKDNLKRTFVEASDAAQAKAKRSSIPVQPINKDSPAHNHQNQGSKSSSTSWSSAAVRAGATQGPPSYNTGRSTEGFQNERSNAFSNNSDPELPFVDEIHRQCDEDLVVKRQEYDELVDIFKQNNRFTSSQKSAYNRVKKYIQRATGEYLVNIIAVAGGKVREKDGNVTTGKQYTEECVSTYKQYKDLGLKLANENPDVKRMLYRHLMDKKQKVLEANVVRTRNPLDVDYQVREQLGKELAQLGKKILDREKLISEGKLQGKDLEAAWWEDDSSGSLFPNWVKAR